MPDKANFPTVFEKLKRILQDVKASEAHLAVKTNTPDTYSLDMPFSEKYDKVLFFGSAQIKKNYVSFYLMPVYMFPDLLHGVSVRLKKRMQGKSCFNLVSPDEELLKEIAALTQKSVERCRQEKVL